MEEDSIILENIANQVGDKLAKSIKTSLNHFNSYVKYLFDKGEVNVAEYKSKYDASPKLTEDFITEDLFAKFADYLMKIKNINKYETTVAYISRVKNILCRDYRNLEIFRTADNWYQRLRSRVLKLYMEKCQKDGTSLKEGAPPMNADDLLKIVTYLIDENTTKSFNQRALMVMQWQTVGRITEVAKLQSSDVNVHITNASNASCCIKVIFSIVINIR